MLFLCSYLVYFGFIGDGEDQEWLLSCLWFIGSVGFIGFIGFIGFLDFIDFIVFILVLLVGDNQVW